MGRKVPYDHVRRDYLHDMGEIGVRGKYGSGLGGGEKCRMIMCAVLICTTCVK